MRGGGVFPGRCPAAWVSPVASCCRPSRGRVVRPVIADFGAVSFAEGPRLVRLRCSALPGGRAGGRWASVFYVKETFFSRCRHLDVGSASALACWGLLVVK